MAIGSATLLCAPINIADADARINSGGPEIGNHSKATGSLTVKIKPKAAKQDGARWRVDGGAWRKGGYTESGLSEGGHTVKYKSIAGWKSPKAKDVTVTANQNTTTTGKYKQESNGDTQTIMLPGDVPMVFVWVPAGSFDMGRYTNEQDSYETESPQHEVTFENGFWLGKYEVTQAQWQAIMNTTPWSGGSYTLSDPNSPAVYVSWTDCQSFATALNAHITNTAQGAATVRLPSEAEWEYACRAGTTTRFYWGDDPSYTTINNYAWWYGNAYDAMEQYAHIVGLKLPNAWGLYDMSGNVREWCEDVYHSSYTGAPSDGSVWVSPTGSLVVARGGSWFDIGANCRSANRVSGSTSTGNFEVGFRLAR